MANKADWIGLADCPGDRYSVPFGVDTTKFAVAEERQAKHAEVIQGILKYDAYKDKWEKWINYPKNSSSRYHTASINLESNTIYIFNNDSELIKINTDSQEFNCMNLRYCGSKCINIQIFAMFFAILCLADNRFLLMEIFQGILLKSNAYSLFSF